MKPSYVFNAYKTMHKAFLGWRHHRGHACEREDLELSTTDTVNIQFLTAAEFVFLIVRMLFIVVLMSYAVGLFFYKFKRRRPRRINHS